MIEKLLTELSPDEDAEILTIDGGIGIFGEPWIVLPFGTELFFDVA